MKRELRDPNVYRTRVSNKKRHLCPACNKLEIIFDIGTKMFYCLKCDRSFTKKELNG